MGKKKDSGPDATAHGLVRMKAPKGVVSFTKDDVQIDVEDDGTIACPPEFFEDALKHGFTVVEG